MGRREKRAYLEQIRARYRKAKRAEKAKILDKFCAVCNYHRKYAIQLGLGADGEPLSRRVLFHAKQMDTDSKILTHVGHSRDVIFS